MIPMTNLLDDTGFPTGEDGLKLAQEKTEMQRHYVMVSVS